MIGLDEVRLITDKLPFADALPPGQDISEDVACIVFRTDVFECGNGHIMNRHIDIETTFGEYIEVHEGDALFQYICTLCSFEVSGKELADAVVYQKQ